jgi:multidrug efflux system outer membrane protein
MTRAALCVLLLAGCMTLPPLPRTEVPVPPKWRSPAVGSEALTNQPWTTLFDDVLLEALIREALQYNSDLRIAADRILQARAQYGIQRSFQFPTISADAAYTRQRAPGASPPTNSTSETASIGLALPSWEIDFWGRLQSLSEAARSEYLATEQAWRQIYITLIGDVATAYIQLVGLDDQLRIAYRTAESRDKSLSIVLARNRGGVASKLDLRPVS